MLFENEGKHRVIKKITQRSALDSFILLCDTCALSKNKLTLRKPDTINYHMNA